MKYVKNALSVILILVFGYIIIGEIVFPYNTPRDGFICYQLPGDNWVEIREDGSRVSYAVPGKADGDITLETTLPTEIDKDISAMCLRGMDMKVYVDGNLRIEQKTKD